MKNDIYMPKVAIIVPIFNVENFLSVCLESCLNQTYKNLEIIMIDDGSYDKSSAIAFEYFLKDKRFVLIKKINGGLSSARNVGLDFLFNELDIEEGSKCNENNSIFTKQKGYYVYKGAFKNARQDSEVVLLGEKQEIEIFKHEKTESKCEYLHFLDSDDCLTLDCIEKCIKTLNDFIEYKVQLKTLSNLDKKNKQEYIRYLRKNTAIWHDSYRVDENGKRLTNHDAQIISMCKNEILSNLDVLEKKVKHQFTICCFTLLSLESFVDNRIRFLDYVHSEDQLLTFMILTNIKNIVFITDELYEYRIRVGSTTNFNTNIHTPPPFLWNLYADFKNKNLAKEYYVSYSFCIMAASLLDFSELFSDTDRLNRINDSVNFNDITHYNAIYLLLQKGAIFTAPSRIKLLRCIDIEKIDPMNAKKLFNRLLECIPKNHFKKTYMYPFFNILSYYGRNIALKLGLRI